MNIKNSNLIEKIGFALIVIGFIFMILNDVWENNPIPEMTDKNMYFNSIGLILWALGYQSRIDKEKKKD
ncbi:MAG: vacuolar-type H+-ATPase subunit I/STV1 [Glaciecola sp.]|jgi:vacuolar-type H+-ATPase subunit I/STV1